MDVTMTAAMRHFVWPNLTHYNRALIVEQAFQETSSFCDRAPHWRHLAAGRCIIRWHSRFAPHFCRIILKDPLEKSTWTTAFVGSLPKGYSGIYRPDLGRSEPYVGALGCWFEVLKSA